MTNTPSSSWPALPNAPAAAQSCEKLAELKLGGGRGGAPDFFVATPGAAGPPGFVELCDKF